VLTRACGLQVLTMGHPNSLTLQFPNLLCSRLGSIGQEEPTATTQDPGDLPGPGVKGTGLLVGATEVLWATGSSLKGSHLHRCV
jgi:hypothetical protein